MTSRHLKALKIVYWANISGIVMNLFETYMDLFLLYLILRFTSKHQDEKVSDEMLGRQVPVLVFIQN